MSECPKLQVLKDHVARLLPVADGQQRQYVGVVVARGPRHLGCKLLLYMLDGVVAKGLYKHSGHWFILVESGGLSDVGGAKTALLEVFGDADVGVREL